MTHHRNHGGATVAPVPANKPGATTPAGPDALSSLIAACEGDKAIAVDCALAGMTVPQARATYGMVKEARQGSAGNPLLADANRRAAQTRPFGSVPMCANRQPPSANPLLAEPMGANRRSASANPLLADADRRSDAAQT